ncbi:hypothetical protein DWB63_06440 [Pseudodesulfovibrio sp. S3]|nr:hypothetical protein DWB63_06440 [Pseudodesulfovibrio sp. S3]
MLTPFFQDFYLLIDFVDSDSEVDDLLFEYVGFGRKLRGQVPDFVLLPLYEVRTVVVVQHEYRHQDEGEHGKEKIYGAYF